MVQHTPFLRCDPQLRRGPRTTARFLLPVELVPTLSDVHAIAARLLADAGVSSEPWPSAVVSGAELSPARRGEESGSDALSRADEMWGALGTALSAWCGPFAYHALLSRALSQAQMTHQPLAALRVGTPSAPELMGLGVMAATVGDAGIAEGSQALLTALINLLVRVIGEEMAVATVSQALTVVRAVPPMGHPAPRSAPYGQPPVNGETGS